MNVAEDLEDWKNIAAQSLSRAYGDDEPEYTEADLREKNPDYKAPECRR